ncbi:hypothetical protein CPB85DRAFT_1331681 [Mucidula mucida]|nr:hypothetical protein CPB85DRAFT_1331681 [Mucidula mucida]
MPSSLLSTATINEMMCSPDIVYQSYQDLLRDCQKWRDYQQRQDLFCPLEESLRLESVVTLPLKGCPSPEDVATGFRLPPPLLRLNANRSERTLDGMLVLVRPLGDEKHVKPHTWLADVVGISDPDSQTSVGRVVLKIAQESNMFIPDTSDPKQDISKVHLSHAITFVAHDYLVAEKLQRLQGGVIPYCYGFIRCVVIKMPNDEDAYILITEYIEGRTLGAWMSENAHPEPPIPSAVLTDYFIKRAPMLPRLLKAITILHDNGVIHRDLDDPDHVLLTDSGAGVVFVDFQTAIPEDTLREGESMKGLSDWDTCRLLWHVTECCDAHKRMVGRWLRGRGMLEMVLAAFFFNYDISDEGPETERNEYEAMKTLRARRYLDID